MTNECNCFQLEYMTSAVVVVTLEVGETTPRGVILNFGGTLSITVLWSSSAPLMIHTNFQRFIWLRFISELYTTRAHTTRYCQQITRRVIATHKLACKAHYLGSAAHPREGSRLQSQRRMYSTNDAIYRPEWRSGEGPTKASLRVTTTRRVVCCSSKSCVRALYITI